MIDTTYEPTITEEDVLLVLKQENRANPQLVCERTRFDENEVRESLQTLESHSWIREVTNDLYEFVDDPRGRQNRIDPSSAPSEQTQTAPIDPSQREETDEK
jgi:hypothetical protein